MTILKVINNKEYIKLYKLKIQLQDKLHSKAFNNDYINDYSPY